MKVLSKDKISNMEIGIETNKGKWKDIKFTEK